MTIDQKIQKAYKEMETNKQRLKNQYRRSFDRLSGKNPEEVQNLNRWYEREENEIKNHFHDEVTEAYN